MFYKADVTHFLFFVLFFCRPHVPTEFDFDDEPVTPKNSMIDRRRTPGMYGDNGLGGDWEVSPM